MLAAGESASTLESWRERSIVVRKHPHDDRREPRKNLAGLPEGKSSTPSSRVIDHEQRDVTELSTAAESAMSRRGMGVVSCLGSSEPAECQSYKAEKCTDVTVSVHKEHMQAVNSCKAQEEIYMDQEAVPAKQIEAEKLRQDVQTPSTVLVWIDVALSGEPVLCNTLFAGAGRLKNHVIETPRVREAGFSLEA